MSKKEKIVYSGVGGEALIEGIMMRGPKGAAMSCRMPDGSIDTEMKDFTPFSKKHKFASIPFIRGPINFVESMVFGYKCMMDSAEKTSLDTSDMKEEDMSKVDRWLMKHFGPKMMTVIGIFSAILGFSLAFVIFFILPTKTFDLINNHLDDGALLKVRPIIEGAMRLVIFVGYMFLVSLLKDIRRVFMYHGAEHMTIFTLERHLDLTVENVRKQERFHPRCGTSFIFVMIILSVLISTIANTLFPVLSANSAIWICIKILLLPIIMSIGYEFIRLAGKHDNPLTRALSAPGLWMQRITTKMPTDDIIEVAIEAIKAVIDEPEEKTETEQ